MDSFNTRIEEKLKLVHLSPQKSYIFKVNHLLRKVNEKAYTPVLISIGPYHYERRELDLQFMEQPKWRYLNDMIIRKVDERTSRGDLLSRCFRILERHEAGARGYYAEAVTLGKVEFIEMMLLDSCFIIEYFFRFDSDEEKKDDPLFQADWIYNSLNRDLVLIENQVPFFVLTKLLNVIGPWPDPDPLRLVYAAVNSLSVYGHLRTTQGKNAFYWRNFALQRISNLVPSGILEKNRSEDTRSEEKGNRNVESLQNIKHLLDLVRKFMLLEDALLVDEKTTDIQVPQQSQRDQDEELMDPQKLIHTASELSEFGVQFRSVNKSKFHEIKFGNGILEIPVLQVDDATEDYFRNLIAYEQHASDDLSGIVEEYISFMDDLIDSSKDVELLRREGIINSLLGDDTEIATMINKMASHITIHDDYYNKVRNDLSKHCKRKRHLWIAKLWMDYLQSPLKILSIMAAVLLLALTLMQTIYTTLSYYHA